MLGTSDTIKSEHAASFRGTVFKVIEEALKSSGVTTARLEIEPTPETEKLRIWIVSDDFRNYNIAERQDIVWRALNDRFKLAV